MSYSNEHLRASDKASAALKATELPRNLAQPIEKQTGDALKKENLIYVLEARLARLQNYKLTRDIKLLDEKTYTERANQLSAYITALKTPASTLPVLSREELNLISQVNNASSSADILRLIRADNGSDQVEAIAAKNLGEIFAQGVAKLNDDGKAKTEITRRANKHFGDMLSQGVFDQATPEQKNAAQAGLEALYQMRYIAKEYIDEKGGITVPRTLKSIWENYRDSMDIKDEWFTWSDSGKTQLAGFLLYDLVPMLVSGGAAGLAGKGIIKVASKMPAITNYVNSGTKVAKVVSVGARTGLAGTEAVIFDASFEAIRNQRMFTSKPNWQQDLIKNAFGFGFSRYLAGATKFTGVSLDPLSNQLVKQGLVVPAIITGVGVSQKLLANDPDAYHGAWEEFLLGAIMTGAFHVTGKALERKSTAPESGIAKVEPSTNGNEVVVTATNGQTFTTRMTEKLRNIVGKFIERFGKNKKVDISESAHGAPLEPRGDNVRIVTSEKLPVPKQEIIRNFVGSMKKGEVKPLTDIGLPGWHVEKMPQGSAKANNVYELSIPGKNPIRIEGKGNLEKTIQQEVRQVNDSAIGKTIATPTDTIVIKENPKSVDTLPNIRVQLESIPKGTGETGIKIGDKEYTVNRHMDDKIDVAMNGGVKTYNSINDFLKDIGGDTGKRGPTLHDDLHKNLHDLQIRRDELKKWKDEHPGNVTYDADLMRTETEIAKINKQLASNIQNAGVKVEGNTNESVVKPGYNLVPSSEIRGERGAGVVVKDGDIKTPRKGVTIEGEFTRVDDTTAPKSEGTSRKGSPEKEYVGFGEEKFPYDRAGLPKLKEDFAADKVKLNELLAERARASEKGDTNAVKKLDDAIEAQKRKVIYGEDLIRRATQADNEATIVAKGTPKERENWLKKWWGLIPLALLLACLLSHCSEEGKKHGGVGTPGPLPTNPTPADILKSCESCYSGPESTLDFRRQNEYGQTLTEKYRNNITRRWMTGKEWKNFVKAFNQNKEKLSVLSGSSQKSVVKAVEAVLGGATTENIKQLQKCIGMFDAVYNNKKGQHYMKDNLDHKGAQDGILGPITTKKLMDFINICTNQPEKTETPPDRSDASIQEASPVDAMANSPGLFGV